MLREFREAGAEMVLALRGDPPKNQIYQPPIDGFRHTADFVTNIKQTYPEMPVYVAGYPEKHPDSPNYENDICHLVKKIAAGADMVLEQFCLDNRIVPQWHKICVEDYGIKVPLVPVVISLRNPVRVFAMSEQSNVSIPDEVAEEFSYKKDAQPSVRSQKACDFMRKQLLALRDANEGHVHVCSLNSSDFLEVLGEFAGSTSSQLASPALRFG